MRNSIAGMMLATTALLSLSACGDGTGSENKMAAGDGTVNGAAAKPADKNLVAALGEIGDLKTANALVSSSGLGTALGGVGPYTLFAPNDAAFDTLGKDKVDALKGQDMRPQAASLMTAHIVPGLVTVQDIDHAVSTAKGGVAKMKTMAGSNLAFSRDGSAIVVKSDDGATARIIDDETIVSNGAVHKIDGLLRTAPPK